jgi:hypothetical protein
MKLIKHKKTARFVIDILSALNNASVDTAKRCIYKRGATVDLSKDKAIASLELEPIKRKLMRGKPAAAWTRERVDAAEKEYRRFLLLMKMYPNEPAAPSADVDRFWHHHIIDTEKYALDCQAVFGYFLHRYPYLGLTGEEGAAQRIRAGARMRELYREVFGTQHDAADTAQGTVTGFSLALQGSPGNGMHEPPPASPTADESDEPEPDDDLLKQLRFVVIENQRYDRMPEPARQLMR